MAETEKVDVQRLVAAEQAARAAGESAAAWWKYLVIATDAAITTDSLERVLHDALAGVRSALGADSAALLLSDESGQELLARASTGIGEDRTSRGADPVGCRDGGTSHGHATAPNR